MWKYLPLLKNFQCRENCFSESPMNPGYSSSLIVQTGNKNSLNAVLKSQI